LKEVNCDLIAKEKAEQEGKKCKDVHNAKVKEWLQKEYSKDLE